LLRVLAVAGALIALIPLVAILAVVGWFSSAGGSAAAAPPELGPATGIPPQFIPLYNEAARVFGVNPFLLAAIHKHETGFSTNPDTYRINFAGCCIGPMQMNVRDGTWNVVKHAYTEGNRPADYPHAESPHPQPTDTFDAIMAAAKLLTIKAGGHRLPDLDESAWRAARGYAGAGPEADRYANEILAIARAFEAQAHSPAPLPEGKLAWPVPPSTPITSRFCERRPWEPCHPGIDLAVPAGTSILAAADGRVTIAGLVSGFGNYICIQHAARLATCYAHLARFAGAIQAGAFVNRGELIAYSGCTGLCFGPHLHFEVRLGAGLPSPPVDPLGYLA
jgi:hypothetical protein